MELVVGACFLKDEYLVFLSEYDTKVFVENCFVVFILSVFSLHPFYWKGYVVHAGVYEMI